MEHAVAWKSENIFFGKSKNIFFGKSENIFWRDTLLKTGFQTYIFCSKVPSKCRKCRFRDPRTPLQLCRHYGLPLTKILATPLGTCNVHILTWVWMADVGWWRRGEGAIHVGPGWTGLSVGSYTWRSDSKITPLVYSSQNKSEFY